VLARCAVLRMAAYAERDEIDGDHKRYKSTMTEKRNTTTKNDRRVRDLIMEGDNGIRENAPIIHNINNREDW